MLIFISKIIIRIIIAWLALAFGFWLILASNMGPAYLPEVMNGALDIWIRFTMIGVAALIWIATPVWFFWSSARCSYNSYRAYKRIKSTNTPR